MSDRSDRAGLAAMSSLGPASADMLIEAGIESPEQLRAIGIVEAYRRLRFACGRRATANFLYALEIAVRDIHWKDLEKDRMAELRTIARAIQSEVDPIISRPAKR